MLQLIFSALGLIVLILDSKTALLGATEGIDLCMKSVIPSLFPMMVFSIMITGNVSAKSGRITQKICQIFGIPPGSQTLLLTGLIGGYPTGAKCIAQAYESGRLKQDDACRMLGFCNNAGPAFVFGMASELFHSSIDIWVLWVTHILSALSVGLILPRKASHQSFSPSAAGMSFVNAVSIATKTMASVCGWVILFRIVLAFCDRWFLWALPETGSFFFYGITELTNGIIRLNLLSSEASRFVCCSIFLAFGGFSILMQTSAAAKSTGLGLYIPGKIIQTGFGLAYSLIWVYLRWRQFNILSVFLASAIILIPYLHLKLRNSKITVAFPFHFVYNKRIITRKR